MVTIHGVRNPHCGLLVAQRTTQRTLCYESPGLAKYQRPLGRQMFGLGVLGWSLLLKKKTQIHRNFSPLIFPISTPPTQPPTPTPPTNHPLHPPNCQFPSHHAPTPLCLFMSNGEVTANAMKQMLLPIGTANVRLIGKLRGEMREELPNTPMHTWNLKGISCKRNVQLQF